MEILKELFALIPNTKSIKARERGYYMKARLLNLLLKILFYPSPKIVINDEEKKLFNQLYDDAFVSPNKTIHYHLSIPKYKFLQYISEKKPIVFHGSNNLSIDTFEPRDQTLFDGKMDRAVFASKDPIWSTFFAVLNKKSLIGSIRNGSLTANQKQKYHFYSLTSPTHENKPWTTGLIYFLPEQSFTHISNGPIQFDEWICKGSVQPIAKLEVEPKDFYFLDKISIHKENESIIKSWLLYKFRTMGF
jgi:hypothetical protein